MCNLIIILVKISFLITWKSWVLLVYLRIVMHYFCSLVNSYVSFLGLRPIYIHTDIVETNSGNWESVVGVKGLNFNFSEQTHTISLIKIPWRWSKRHTDVLQAKGHIGDKTIIHQLHCTWIWCHKSFYIVRSSEDLWNIPLNVCKMYRNFDTTNMQYE